MGRETKLLLALLGLLVGVFLGVVSMKLFVPRPPEGAGPDVHGDIATVEAQAIVEPPALVPPPAIAAAPPSATEAPSPPPEPDVPARDSRFGGDVAEAPRDPFVVPAAFETPAPHAMATAAEPAPLDPVAPLEPASPPDLEPTPPLASPPAALHPEPAAAARFEPLTPAPPAAVPGETYVTQSGDSWWSLAERAYGDGRLYRALFAWNRRLDPRVSLSPGTRLELPPAAQLGAAWPGLMPRD